MKNKYFFNYLTNRGLLFTKQSIEFLRLALKHTSTYFYSYFEHTYFVHSLSLCFSHNEKHTGYALAFKIKNYNLGGVACMFLIVRKHKDSANRKH